MANFTSGFAQTLEAMLCFKESHGFSRKTHEHSFVKFDRFCTMHYPNNCRLDKKIVKDWLEVEARPEKNGIRHKASAIRQFGKYLVSIGQDAYVLPLGYERKKSSFVPYIFTDSELTALFWAIDELNVSKNLPLMHEVAPVLFRLMYTCGLRPNEARELGCDNIDLHTGKVLIVNNKKKKQRLIVMSPDMLELCQKYNSQRSIFAHGNPFFFPNVNGEAYTHIQVRVVFKMCWRLANPNISKEELPNVRPYDLRHRFASAVLHKWIDEQRDLYAMLPYLRTFMGHEHISDTASYIHVLPENLLNSDGVDWNRLDEIEPGVSVWDA